MAAVGVELVSEGSGLENNDNNVNDVVGIPIIPDIGIIYPPPEIRSIVDKTAEYVAKHGMDFEEKIRSKESLNTKFNFLNMNDPYFTYYKHMLSEYQHNPNRDKVPTTKAPTIVSTWGSVVTVEAKPFTPHVMHKSTVCKKRRTILDISEPTCPTSALPPYEYYMETPLLSPVDLDTVKITAQFVAKNGRQFLQSLIMREQKNYLFDFLKPQHNLYQHFTKLSEQYTKILAPSNEMLQNLIQDCKSTASLLEKVRVRYEWARYHDKERRKEVDEVEREKSAFSQIDWHEFVIVEVIGFREDEKANLPPPVSLEQLGARVLAQERFEKLQASGEVLPNTSTIKSNEMDLDEIKNRPIVPVTETIPADATVRKDYDPKKNTTQPKPALPQQIKPRSAEKYLVSPITGELVPADQMEQHLKISLLDPRWKEQKQKQMDEKKHQEQILAGLSISAHLMDLAQRRSDIFGPGHEETMIGKKLDEKEDPHVKRAAPIHWESKAIAAQVPYRPPPPQPATIDKQLEALQAARAEAFSREQAACISKPPAPRGAIPAMNIPQVVGGPMYMHSNLPPMTASHGGAGLHTMVGGVGGVGGNGSSNGTGASPNMMGASEYYNMVQPGMCYYETDPSTLRIRAEEELIPEDQYLAAYGGSPINIQVRIPDQPEISKKNNWQLQGQIEHFTMNLTDTISLLKTHLSQHTGVPITKQKILIGMGRFAKDTNTLAFYNIHSNTLIQLQLKERGGRK